MLFIPMSEAKSIVDDLINYGYVTGRPQLGISCQDVTEAVSQAYNIPVGAYIFSVTAGGAADQARHCRFLHCAMAKRHRGHPLRP